jgi:hypothetical protein
LVCKSVVIRAAASQSSCIVDCAGTIATNLTFLDGMVNNRVPLTSIEPPPGQNPKMLALVSMTFPSAVICLCSLVRTSWHTYGQGSPAGVIRYSPLMLLSSPLFVVSSRSLIPNWNVSGKTAVILMHHGCWSLVLSPTHASIPIERDGGQSSKISVPLRFVSLH